MNSIEKLQKVYETGVTQQNLAFRLGVSFVTLNSWLQKKSVPRKKHQEKINSVYLEIFGIDEISLKEREKIEKIKERIPLLQDSFLLSDIIKNQQIINDILVKITYNSNSIEGSTVTQYDTEQIILHKKVYSDYSLREQLEVENHKKAFFLALELSKKKNIQEKDILELHKILMAGILDNAGIFRYHPVRILGSGVSTANHLKIPVLIQKFLENFHKKSRDPLQDIAISHTEFEKIHPFSDGNGRIGRLLMMIHAFSYSLPPIIIQQEKKQAYYKYLQKSQIKGEYSLLSYLIFESFWKIDT